MVVRWPFRAGFLVAVVTSAAPAAPAQTHDPRSCASVDSNGGFHGGLNGLYAVSADGRFVSFISNASGFVSGDTNGCLDVFVHDRVTGATVCVSVDSSGVQGDGPSVSGVLSADGRFVAFASDATNLVAGDGNGTTDVFVHDRDPDGNGVFDEGNGITTRVSVRSNGVEANGASLEPSISADGSKVAFSSNATNLVAGDRNGKLDVFVHNRTTGATKRVSVDSAGLEADDASEMPSLSGDGSRVAFSSLATNLVAGDGNGREDAFVRDLKAGTTVRASVDSSGGEADRESWYPRLSQDGSFVVFSSFADNLVANDSNGNWDVFLHDFSTGTTELESCDSNGVGGDGGSLYPAISADGRVVAFAGTSTNLDPHDVDADWDVFVRDLATGVTSLVSRTCWGESVGGVGSFGPWLSGDGSIVGFTSPSSELVLDDTNTSDDAFVYDRSIPEPTALAVQYGSGYAGTLGIPGLTSSAPPAFGASVSITVDNSIGSWTPAVLAVGPTRASIPTRAGGTLLVDAPTFFVESIPPLGLSLPFTTPFDIALCGASIDLQCLELDAGAQYGISFTPGLEWTFGN